MPHDPTRVALLEAVAEAGAAWQKGRDSLKNYGAECDALSDALDALAAHTEPKEDGETVEVRARVSRSESGDTIRVYGMTTDRGKTWSFEFSPPIATITARIPLPTLPTIPATVEGSGPGSAGA